MQYTWPALSAVWITIFGVFGLIGSGTVTGPGGLMLMLLGSVAPAIILTLDEKRQKAVATPQLPSSRRTPDSGRSG
jgi:hypothetical protein